MTVIAFLAMNLTASAQYDDPAYWRTSVHVLSSGWSTVWAEFNPSVLENDNDDTSVTGISLGYSLAFPLITDVDLYLEPGLGLQYTFKSDDEKKSVEGYSVKQKTDFNMWSVKVPVNFLYKFEMGNSGFSLSPFAGLTMRYNFSAKEKVKVTYNGESESETVDLFSSSDMGGSNYTWKRFQLGWQVGLKAIIADAFMLGASYGRDFSEIAKDTKLQTTTITLGFCF